MSITGPGSITALNLAAQTGMFNQLNTLAQEARRDVPGNLTKAQASELIDELQQQTGRGAQPAAP